MKHLLIVLVALVSLQAKPVVIPAKPNAATIIKTAYKVANDALGPHSSHSRLWTKDPAPALKCLIGSGESAGLSKAREILKADYRNEAFIGGVIIPSPPPDTKLMGLREAATLGERVACRTAAEVLIAAEAALEELENGPSNGAFASRFPIVAKDIRRRGIMDQRAVSSHVK